MRINSQKFTTEDFKDQPWIGKLLSPLNTFIGEVLQMFNGNIAMEQLSQEVREVNLINKAENLPIKFKQRFNRRILGLSIVYCFDKTNNVALSIKNLPVWTNANGLVTINSIEGLTTDNEYMLRFWVIYEN